MKVKIITGNKPAPGSTLLNKFFKIDGFIIKDIHPNKEQLVKIMVTITNSDFSLNLIPIKKYRDGFSHPGFINYFFLWETKPAFNKIGYTSASWLIILIFVSTESIGVTT